MLASVHVYNKAITDFKNMTPINFIGLTILFMVNMIVHAHI